MQDPNTRAENARRNGALSKGPITAEGKSRASQNAVRPGITAGKTVILQNENPEAWSKILASHIDRYRPIDTIEHDLVDDIAFCRWRLLRFRGVDTALWDLQMEDSSEEFTSRYNAVDDETARLAYAFRKDGNLHLASRYEGRLRRAYERAIRNLKVSRGDGPARNEKQQNEPTGTRASDLKSGR